MILAPRSWPSRPGFAITTRIFPGTPRSINTKDRREDLRHSERLSGRDDVRMKLTVVGCSPAWPNPGGAQSGYLLEGPGRLLLDCGPGVLARLRETYSSNGWPEVDAIAITHFHLDHWGDLVPWVWGTMWGLGRGKDRPELWLPPGGREDLAAFGTRFGTPDMFIRAFELHEYAEGEPFTAAGLQVTAVRLPHYTVKTYGFRVANETRTVAYSG